MLQVDFGRILLKLLIVTILQKLCLIQQQKKTEMNILRYYVQYIKMAANVLYFFQCCTVIDEL